MQKYCYALESFRGISQRKVMQLINTGIQIYAIQPFWCFHKIRGAIIGFPDDLPAYARTENNNGIEIISAEHLNARDISAKAMDKGAGTVEEVWPVYRKEFKNIIDYTRKILGDIKAENAFKRILSEQLTTFYSANELYFRLSEILKDRPIMLNADTNVYSYQHFLKLLKQSDLFFHAIPNLEFTKSCRLESIIEKAKLSIRYYSRVIAQSGASLVSRKTKITQNKPHYKYGFSIISGRQLRDNRRGPDLLVDGDQIRPEETAYFPLVPLTPDQNARLEKIPGSVVRPHEMGRFFSNAREWIGLARQCFKNRPLANHEEVRAASAVLFHYFAWKDTVSRIKLDHFVTHCDFTLSHMGRNMALEQAGVKTWYFTDSMNFGNNMTGYIPGCKMRHPYWTYLDYDHFVTWHGALGEYFRLHPESFRNVHVSGCLWAEHALKTDPETGQELLPADPDQRVVLAVFDSTYTRNSTSNYSEGIAFARQIRDLADRMPELFVVFKEKKGREIHNLLDQDLGPRLIETYVDMGKRPNIVFCDNNVDASQMIGLSDAVISFPFTSTTFEALSVDKPAVWHDPLGYYGRNLFDSVAGIVTHGPEELQETIAGFVENKGKPYQNPVPSGSPLLDPYRDGKAIERFRALLAESKS